MKKFNIRHLLSKRFTLMLVPHGSGQARQINIPLSFILLMVSIWTGVTCWGSYLSAKHVDYWRTKLSNEVLTLKVNYLVNQIDKTSSFLDQVKQIEFQLQNMISYKDEATLIKNSVQNKTQGTGGPTSRDQKDLAHLLKHGNHDISWEALVEKATFFRNETEGRISEFQKLTNAIERKKQLYLSTPLGWPCDGRLTSHFGTRLDPFSGSEEFHFGVDIANNIGTAIRATADGEIRVAGWMSGYGNLVVVDHQFGYSTRYAHNSKILVKPGQIVKRGQIIAHMGMTGKANGPHSHYEVWQHNKRKNPFKYLDDTVFSNKASASNKTGTTQNSTLGG